MLCISALLVLVHSGTCLTLSPGSELFGKRAASTYAPVTVACPSSSLVRQGHNVSSDEAAYIEGRRAKADKALASWLGKVGFDNADASPMPVVAMSTSGGGFRSMLTGAGIHMAFDGREGTEQTSGLLQGVSYESGLSGGGWLVTALVGNNYPLVSVLQDFWHQQLPNPFPGDLGLIDTLLGKGFVADMAAKQAAGFPPTLIDAYGQLLSPLLVATQNGGTSATWSGFTNLTNFTSFDMPFPILTSIGVNPYTTMDCSADSNGTQFEFTPYEFGSWDTNVDAFMRIEYLGTKMNNGQPADSSTCIKGFDRQALIGGTTSNVWAGSCMNDQIQIPGISKRSPEQIYNIMSQLWSTAVDGPVAALTASTDERDYYGAYPNPFQGFTSSSLLSQRDELTLLDGATSGQNDPIWPFLHRDVDVLILSDNGGGNTDVPYTSGLSLYNTYLRSQQTNLTRMPEIPSDPDFFRKEYGLKPRFFGCSDKSKMTIVSLPNQDFVFKSANRGIFQWAYTPAQTTGMIANGVAIATNNGSSNWPMCLGCAIMDKSPGGGKLPLECNDCFKEYCVGTFVSTDGATETSSTVVSQSPDTTTADPATSSTGAASSLLGADDSHRIGLMHMAIIATSIFVGGGFFGHLVL